MHSCLLVVGVAANRAGLREVMQRSYRERGMRALARLWIPAYAGMTAKGAGAGAIPAYARNDG